MAIKIDPPLGLAADQRQVFSALRKLVHHSTQADRLYDTLPDSHNGRIISVDVARYLSPAFTTWDGRIRHTQSTGAPAGAYAHDRLIRELQRPSKSARSLLVTAGGAGSGKTSALNDLYKSAHSQIGLVFDNQLRNYKRARQILAHATSNNWTVDVVFVFRPFRDIVRGVAERSQRTGRWNYIYELPSMHQSALATFLKLTKDCNHTSINFHAIQNMAQGQVVDFAPAQSPRGVNQLHLSDLARLAEYDLPHAHQADKIIKDVLQECQAQGLICQPLIDLITQKGPGLAQVG